ncbi:MAG TPA: hypothetical protein ACFCUD_14660 [Cyclobacteriaceae bacterium]
MKRLDTIKSYKKVWNTPEIQPMDASMTESLPKGGNGFEPTYVSFTTGQYYS